MNNSRIKIIARDMRSVKSSSGATVIAAILETAVEETDFFTINGRFQLSGLAARGYGLWLVVWGWAVFFIFGSLGIISRPLKIYFLCLM